MDKDDREIIGLSGGNIETFRIIFNREAPLLRAFAGKFVDHFTAQDIIQDVFLKVWMNREAFPNL
ncbi:hypothetical protein FACS1894174_05660 [Bacteroidia bacterium]|nr:hypothetical protein FACS1894174_05660 [Bacteroidia bacterium]